MSRGRFPIRERIKLRMKLEFYEVRIPKFELKIYSRFYQFFLDFLKFNNFKSKIHGSNPKILFDKFYEVRILKFKQNTSKFSMSYFYTF